MSAIVATLVACIAALVATVYALSEIVQHPRVWRIGLLAFGVSLLMRITDCAITLTTSQLTNAQAPLRMYLPALVMTCAAMAIVQLAMMAKRGMFAEHDEHERGGIG